MKREILEKQFNQEQIKQREGHLGKMLDYIEGHAVIQRLNDAFDSNWSFNVIEHNILKETGEVVILGQLSAGNIVKSQFGSSKITKNRQTSEMVSLADDLKAAATDALKKCATLLGVGLHLYNRGNGHGNRSNGNGRSNDNGQYKSNVTYNNGNGKGQQYQNKGNGNGNGSNGNGKGRLSGKQYKYIMSLMSNLGKSKPEIDKHCVEAYGTSVQHLSRTDASRMIKSMVGN